MHMYLYLVQGGRHVQLVRRRVSGGEHESLGIQLRQSEGFSVPLAREAYSVFARMAVSMVRDVQCCIVLPDLTSTVLGRPSCQHLVLTANEE